MQNYRKTRQTAKAKKAVEMLGRIYNIKPQYMRRDKSAIQQSYFALEEMGYEWISDKQEWALLDQGATPFEPQTARFVFACEGVNDVEGQYVIAEGLKAAGYEIVRSELVYDLNDPDHGYIHIEVKL